QMTVVLGAAEFHDALSPAILPYSTCKVASRAAARSTREASLRTRRFIMAIPLSADLRTLLDEPNFAHLATLLPDGSPQSAPVWIDVEGDRVLIATGEGSLKSRNTKRDPRVSLSVVAMDNPYREAQLRGRVVERRP